MCAESSGMFTLKEINRVKIIQDVIERRMTTHRAAGAIVDNKRLGRTLEFIQLVQSNRDDTRSQSVPAGDGPSRRRPRAAGKKTQRALNQDDMLEALQQLQSRSEQIFGKKPG